MITLVSNLEMADMLTAKDSTEVKNPDKADIEIITREGGKVSRYIARDAATGSRQGQGVGMAYFGWRAGR